MQFTLDGVQVALTPASIVAVSVAATESTAAPGTTAPPLEPGDDDDDEGLRGGVIAAIVICVLAVVAGGLVVASKQAHKLRDHKSPRVSISEAFEESLPSQAPLENEAPLSFSDW